MQPSELSEALPYPLKRFTVEEWHRLVDVGGFSEDDHLELLDGMIVQMTPQGRSHMRLIDVLNRFLTKGLSDEFWVRVQGPLTLADSEPEPDIAVVSREEEEHSPRHPRTALLVVEVAGSSGSTDRRVKSRIYAKANVPEYWIADVENGQVEVYTQPDAASGTYGSRRVAKRGEALQPTSLPGLSIAVEALFVA
ncbi:MAG: Uma2 family endonuclease [Myxococcaceae bacterium]